MLDWPWLGRLIEIVESKSALQRRAFLLSERARSKSAARRAKLIPLARPKLRRRLMPADKLNTPN